ncbi:hypothetical protein N9739_05815 [Burkholderiaceae bacterium]|nr:hypothetical protein [Burkholderiaceae bacterium]
MRQKVCQWLSAARLKADFAPRWLTAWGGDALVAPVYAMYQRLVVIYGETPDVEAMVDAEREVFESWQAAETAAMIAAFGTHRYLDEGGFELTITE